MKKILVPIDFSLEADNAAHYAAHLAQFFHAKLTLLYVCHMPVPITHAPVPVDSSYLEKENGDLIKCLAAELTCTYQIATECTFISSSYVDEILEEIEEEHADLVVMGTNGADEKFHFLCGNTPASVMRKCPIPVLIIPGGALFKLPKNILMAFDSHKINNSNLFKPLFSLCMLFNCNLSLLNVYVSGMITEAQQAIAQARFSQNLPGIKYELFFEANEEVEAGLNHFLDSHTSDILVVLPHEHSLLDRIFQKTYSKKLTLHSTIPVLALHDSAQQ